jgi:predicted nucleotidyltransferase
MKQKAFRLMQQQRQQLMKRLEELLRNREEIVFAYLYGSFAEDLPFHDIDVGIYIESLKEEEATPYSLTLAKILSKTLQTPVDVRILNFAPVLFLYHVIHGILIFERKEEIHSRFMERIIQRYLDLKPLIQKGTQEAFRR